MNEIAPVVSNRVTWANLATPIVLLLLLPLLKTATGKKSRGWIVVSP